MNSMVSNEIFSGGMIGLAIFLAVRFGFGHKLSWRDALLIGSGCGLGLLSKYTGLFVFLSVVFLLFLRQVSHQETEYKDDRMSPTALLLSFRLPPVLLIAVTLTISGWLYARNLIHFGDPFIGNWDRASGFSYKQLPGYRTLNFYTRFGSVFFHIPEHSKWGSFWDGKYASMWADSHNAFLKHRGRLYRDLESMILWLAFLPSVAILFGFGKAFLYLLRREWDHPFLILVLTSVLSVVSVILFTMEVPYFSTVKAFFFLSLISSIGVFAALGLEMMCQQLGRLRWLLYGNLATLYGIILYLFWYRVT